MRYIIILLSVAYLNGFSQPTPQKISRNNQIIEHLGFVLSYNEGCEQANWVKYTLTAENLEDRDLERKSYFSKDMLIEGNSPSHSDYSHSGYDRGHLKPAGDELKDQKRKDATFIMSNVSPQYSGFNRGIWRVLEDYVRNKAIENDSIVIVTGGIIDDSLSKMGNICIPTNFYKVLFLFKDEEMITEAYIIPNTSSKVPVETYKTTLKMVEIKAKLKFL